MSKNLTIDGLTLVCTCGACPEQYDVFDGETQVAYFRLRHGFFTVDVPDFGGREIYAAEPIGDGLFRDGERMIYLREAVREVRAAMNQQPTPPAGGRSRNEVPKEAHRH